MFAPAVDVKQIDEVFPTLIETLQVCGNVFAGGELSVIRIDLILHPAQVFDGFTFTWIETFDDGFSLGFAQLARFLFGAAFDEYRRRVHAYVPFLNALR